MHSLCNKKTETLLLVQYFSKNINCICPEILDTLLTTWLQYFCFCYDVGVNILARVLLRPMVLPGGFERIRRTETDDNIKPEVKGPTRILINMEGIVCRCKNMKIFQQLASAVVLSDSWKIGTEISSKHELFLKKCEKDCKLSGLAGKIQPFLDQFGNLVWMRTIRLDF